MADSQPREKNKKDRVCQGVISNHFRKTVMSNTGFISKRLVLTTIGHFFFFF